MHLNHCGAGTAQMDREMKKIHKPRRGQNAKASPAEATAFTGTRRALSTDEKGVGPDGATLRQPDERDQSADQQATLPRKAMKQAHDDVQSGQQDTDCRNRVADILPDTPKTSRNFDAASRADTAPHVAKKK